MRYYVWSLFSSLFLNASYIYIYFYHALYITVNRKTMANNVILVCFDDLFINVETHTLENHAEINTQ